MPYIVCRQTRLNKKTYLQEIAWVSQIEKASKYKAEATARKIANSYKKVYPKSEGWRFFILNIREKEVT